MYNRVMDLAAIIWTLIEIKCLKLCDLETWACSACIISRSFVLFLSFFTRSAEDYFDPQPSWFDTLSNCTGCSEIVIHPVRAKDLDAKKISDSSNKPANPKISKATEDETRSKTSKHRAKQNYKTKLRPIKSKLFLKKGNGYVHHRPLPFSVSTASMDHEFLA